MNLVFVLFFSAFFFGFPGFLSATETVFQGFRSQWIFYSGTKISEKGDVATIPIKPGGMYFGFRKELEPGTYLCLFEYEFKQRTSPSAQFQFSSTTTPPLYLNFGTKEGTNQSIRLLLANTRKGIVKIGFSVHFSEQNLLELKNFRLERLSDLKFEPISFPDGTEGEPFWFNRSGDRKNVILKGEIAEDYALGGGMIQLKTKANFKANVLLCLATLDIPLPVNKNLKLSFLIKSDQIGTVRVAVADHIQIVRTDSEWKKYSFEFMRPTGAKATANVSFQTLTGDIRTISVKNVIIEELCP